MRSGGAEPVRVHPAAVVPPSTAASVTVGDMAMMTNPQKALNWAMTNADVDAMLHILSSSAAVDVDERDRACGMQTTLMRLCHLPVSQDDRSTILRQILIRDPDVNIKDTSGRTALAHACIAEKADIVECLAEVPQCDPSLRDNDGNTPLMHAVRTRKVSFVQTLLGCFYDRLDINAKNNKGTTALSEAESRQDLDIYRALVSEGGAVPFPSNPPPASVINTPRSSVSDLRFVSSPHLSRASSTPRRRLEALPPTVLPYRPRVPMPEDILSPRGVRTAGGSRGDPGSSLLGDNLSDTSSTVLLSLPEDSRSPTMPRKNARKKESASEFGGASSSRGHQGKTRRMVAKQHTLPDIVNSQAPQLTVNGFQNVEDAPDKGSKTQPDHVSVESSRQSSPMSLPKLPEEIVEKNPKPEMEKPPRRRRKNSASLPNLTNAAPSFLVSPHRNHSNSSDNIAGAAASAAVENRALDWERGVRSSYRKDNQDFKLPQLNVTLNGGLTAGDWCGRCGHSKTLCGCGGEPEARIESSRLSSKGKTRSSGNGLERMLYLSGDRLTVRASRTFTSGD